jgi:hypothetical protein
MQREVIQKLVHQRSEAEVGVDSDVVVGAGHAEEDLLMLHNNR